MKKQLLFSFLTILLSETAQAQHAGNALGLNAVDYIEVPDDPDGSLDIPDVFTFEAWVFSAAPFSNQKVAGKLAADFVNGFIFGIEDNQVNVEVFDVIGTNNKLKAGYISNIGWSHVACNYQIGGVLAIYINGIKAGETAVSSNPVNFNTNPFRIGIAPWDVNALGFTGYIDEVRYWQAALDEAVIKEWMHQDLTDAHPNVQSLTLYHKYNQVDGPAVLDETVFGNNGTFSSTGGQVLEPFFLPFKGDFDLFDNDVQGVWNAKTIGTSDILTVEAQFADSLELEQTAVFSHSGGDYSTNNDAPPGYQAVLSKTWRVTTQGGFLADIVFDLGPINLPNVGEVALLASEDPDFSTADIIPGEVSGNTFTANEAFADGFYYTLGFKTVTATNHSLEDTFQARLVPNPSNGAFFLVFEKKHGGNGCRGLQYARSGGLAKYPARRQRPAVHRSFRPCSVWCLCFKTNGPKRQVRFATMGGEIGVAAFPACFARFFAGRRTNS